MMIIEDDKMKTTLDKLVKISDAIGYQIVMVIIYDNLMTHEYECKGLNMTIKDLNDHSGIRQNNKYTHRMQMQCVWTLNHWGLPYPQ